MAVGLVNMREGYKSAAPHHCQANQTNGLGLTVLGDFGGKQKHGFQRSAARLRRVESWNWRRPSSEVGLGAMRAGPSTLPPSAKTLGLGLVL